MTNKQKKIKSVIAKKLSHPYVYMFSEKGITHFNYEFTIEVDARELHYRTILERSTASLTDFAWSLYGVFPVPPGRLDNVTRNALAAQNNED